MALPVRVLAGVLACAFLLVVPAFAQGAENLTPQLADTPDVAHAKYDGVQHLHYKYGPLADPGRAEQHRDRREPGAEAEGRRLDHPHAAEPAADGRHRAAGRRHPPPPRGVAQRDAPRRRVRRHRLRALLRRRRGEDDLPAAAGLRHAVPRVRQVDPQLHDPQPHAAADQGLHHLGHRLRPRQRAAAPRGWSRPIRCGWTFVRRDLPGLRRASRRRHERCVHLPGPGSQRLSGRPPAQHVDGRPRHAAAGRRRDTCIRAACTTTSG